MIHSIPAMTHPLGKHWNQPDMSKVLVDDNYALMDKNTFDKILDGYHHSMPTGVYEGKCWRRGDTLIWYGTSEEPDLCSINSRKILVV